jgi:ribosomal protein S18 acetylase RimI-like enzyme
VSDLSRVAIRLAKAADAVGLAHLRYAFRASEDPVTESESDFLRRCSPWMAQRLVPNGSWRCWLAEEAGELVGMLWLQTIEKLPNPVSEPETHGYITSFYVKPSHRGAGLGTRLMEDCIQACQHDGIDALILWPTPRSRHLYERYGFGVCEDLFERRLALNS